MHFYEITALSDCVPGAFGILEPAGEEKDRITTPGFMLVPGLAFDKNGNRLGYGGGFYDKYLASHEEIITAALGYDFQIVEKVPSESHDRRMDYLIYLGKTDALEERKCLYIVTLVAAVWMFAYALASEPCSEATNIEALFSSRAVFAGF